MRNRSGLILASAFLLFLAFRSDAAEKQETIQEIIKKAKERVYPSLVFVKNVRETYEEGKKQRQVVWGSGVIVDKQGYIVSNNHVCEKSTDIRCVLQDRIEFKVKVVGLDKNTDLALLKILPKKGKDGRDEELPEFPVAELGDSDKLVEGDYVMAMGAPYGLTRSVSFGIVSNTQRYLETDPFDLYTLWIQTDAAINPGNSGGPLVNTLGEVVGINTLGAGEGLGFSIPSNMVREVVAILREKGEMDLSWTGLQLQALKDFFKSTFIDADEGVLVAGVDPGSPADSAGFEKGDLILTVNGEKFNGVYMTHLPKLRWKLARLSKGQPAKVVIRRDGKRMTLNLAPVSKGRWEGKDLELKRWNMTLKQITKYANPQLYYFRKNGVFVQGVKYPGNALDAGLQRGDIVLSIDGKKIETLEDAERAHVQAIEDAGRRKKRAVIEIFRNGKMYRKLVLDWTIDYQRLEDES